ncbi:MFS transporter [Phenylobacterium montanum]|uniref:MFS transporter n=1 Tax=Phenylobacterium montanum TaxID=2823693 RepID=A0A975IVT6_9CAUL|nr:MFS transporter [Caulobacter sp. S6]QUD89115.1 MFS transporter [Caulobacter sp. S6]
MTTTATGSAAAGPDAPAAPAILKRHVGAAVIGNALEFYDFTTFTFFAGHIGRAFFPSANAMDSLLWSLATFGVGFSTRPLGAIVIGHIGDRHGRKPAMLISFALMGLAILAMALCPSYAAIGPAAPVLIVLIRLVQGFALGGEVGPSTAFLLEAAPPQHRGLYTAMQSVSQNIAALVAGLVGMGLASLLSEAQLGDFGWRIALGLGAVVLPFGLMIRRTLPETLHHYEPPSVIHRESDGFQWRVILCSMAMLVGGTVATYIQSYLTTYAHEILHMTTSVAFSAPIVYGVVGIGANLVGGVLSDRVGRRPLIALPRIVFLLAVLPSFWLLDRHRDAMTLVLITLVITVCASTSGGAIMSSITESIRKSDRSRTLAIAYAVTIALFGGTTQFVATWLIAATHDNLSPAYFCMVATAIGIVGALAIRESAPAKVGA